MGLTKCLAAAAICAGGWVLPAVGAADKPADVPSEAYTHPQQLVAIDGSRRLNLFCLGSGSPTVVFEAGTGNSMSVWRHVQGQVASFTRACAYDRAGFGFSDPPGRAVDATNVADDLQRLIVAAPIATPIVLVGHSIGGMYATLFAGTRRDEVAGLVLVDPSFAHEWENFVEHATGVESSVLFGTFRDMTDRKRACDAIIRAAAPGQPPSAKEQDCLPTSAMPEHPDPMLLATMTAQWMQPAPSDALVSEAENFIATTEGGGHPPVDDAELDSAPGTLGDMPLVVLTAGKTMSNFPGLTPTQRTQIATAWAEGHDALAHRSTQGKNIAVPESGHYIQVDRPGVVVDAVREVVLAVQAAAAAH